MEYSSAICRHYLDEETFRKTMWHHRSLTDIWNIGRGTARRLERHGIVDLHGITVADSHWLYKEFGVNAEYLIDHAWGREGCMMRQLKSYRAKTHSIANSQILFEDYAYEDALIVLVEMVEFLALENPFGAKSDELNKDYSIWAKQFGAFATLRGFDEMLEEARGMWRRSRKIKNGHTLCDRLNMLLINNTGILGCEIPGYSLQINCR